MLTCFINVITKLKPEWSRICDEVQNGINERSINPNTKADKGLGLHQSC